MKHLKLTHPGSQASSLCLFLRATVSVSSRSMLACLPETVSSSLPLTSANSQKAPSPVLKRTFKNRYSSPTLLHQILVVLRRRIIFVLSGRDLSLNVVDLGIESSLLLFYLSQTLPTPFTHILFTITLLYSNILIVSEQSSL